MDNEEEEMEELLCEENDYDERRSSSSSITSNNSIHTSFECEFCRKKTDSVAVLKKSIEQEEGSCCGGRDTICYDCAIESLIRGDEEIDVVLGYDFEWNFCQNCFSYFSPHTKMTSLDCDWRFGGNVICCRWCDENTTKEIMNEKWQKRIEDYDEKRVIFKFFDCREDLKVHLPNIASKKEIIHTLEYHTNDKEFWVVTCRNELLAESMDKYNWREQESITIVEDMLFYALKSKYPSYSIDHELWSDFALFYIPSEFWILKENYQICKEKSYGSEDS